MRTSCGCFEISVKEEVVGVWPGLGTELCIKCAQDSYLYRLCILRTEYTIWKSPSCGGGGREMISGEEGGI